jgi:hypothetical protein
VSQELAAHVATLEREVTERRARVAELRAKIDATRERRATLEDLWGGAVALPIGPVLAALMGIVCANAAAFLGYVVFLSRWSEQLWDAGCIGAALVSAITLPLSARFGAGGRGRVGMRRVTLALLAATAVELVAASVFPR